MKSRGNQNRYRKTWIHRKIKKAGFTLIEVIIASSILALGLLSIVKVFPYGIEVSQRSEDLTQATMLAMTIFEGLKGDPVNFPVIPGAPNMIVPIPGNGYDDDTNNVSYDTTRNRGRRSPSDLNRNGIPDVDFDGLPEKDAVNIRSMQPNGLDDDGDGIIDDDGDSGSPNSSSVPRAFAVIARDGDYFYDPEPTLDEEYADGIDNDRDGLIDEDTRLASVRVLGSNLMLPLLAGDGMDNDGDGEDNDDNVLTPAIPDNIDNNGDGRIDEGIDEEIWNGRDDDRDGRIDEDCSLARFPFMPSQLPAPYNRYSWQIRVGSVPDNGRFGLEDVNGDGVPDLGDGIDNDGDGFVDEELPDGLDLDYPISSNRRGFSIQGYTQNPTSDGLVDEDCIVATLPNWRRVEILIAWGGDGIDNDEDLTSVDPRAATRRSTSSSRTQLISYGGISWGIDEEKLDGIDNDLDGKIDEDTHKFEYTLVGFINLDDPAQSFTFSGGQPRGIAPSTISQR